MSTEGLILNTLVQRINSYVASASASAAGLTNPSTLQQVAAQVNQLFAQYVLDNVMVKAVLFEVSDESFEFFRHANRRIVNSYVLSLFNAVESERLQAKFVALSTTKSRLDQRWAASGQRLEAQKASIQELRTKVQDERARIANAEGDKIAKKEEEETNRLASCKQHLDAAELELKKAESDLAQANSDSNKAETVRVFGIPCVIL